MIFKIARSIREYKWAAIFSPLAMVGEVTMEVLIPLVMASLYDYGVAMQDMQIVLTRSVQLVICALLSLGFGVLSAVLGVFAHSGANILTINQSIPVSGCAAVTITAETNSLSRPIEEVEGELRRTVGVVKCEIQAG